MLIRIRNHPNRFCGTGIRSVGRINEKLDNVPAESIDIHLGEPDFHPGTNRATPEYQVPLGFELGAILDSGIWLLT